MLTGVYNTLCMLDCIQAQYGEEARCHVEEHVPVLRCYNVVAGWPTDSLRRLCAGALCWAQA